MASIRSSSTLFRLLARRNLQTPSQITSSLPCPSRSACRSFSTNGLNGVNVVNGSSSSTNQGPPVANSGSRSGPVKIKQTPRFSRYRFSTNGLDGGGVNGDGSSPSNTAGPVKIKQTPRAAAKQKVLSTNGLNDFKNGQPHAPPPLVNGSANGSSSTTTQQEASNGAPTAPPTTTNSPQQQQHPAHHYMNGGTPCDPAQAPFYLANYGEESLYTLVLLRHGESEWNLQNRYTGWCDVDLTEQGRQEARTAGRLLYENGIELDHAFTSVLKRASFSCNMALNTAQQHYVPVTKTWRLNERHYGALQGYNKDSAYKELSLDQELVMQMRRSYDVRPPRMPDHHPYWHGNDRRYRNLSPVQLENSRAESLKDAADRIMPFYDSVITPSMQSGKKCLIVSHANTIRTLVKHIDGISDEDIKGMTIPTGIPLLYRLDRNMKPVDPTLEMEFRYMVEPKGYTWGTSRAHGFHGVYLGDLERLQGIQHKRDIVNRDWQRIILRNVGKSLGWNMDAAEDGSNGAAGGIGNCKVATGRSDPKVIPTRQLWWQVHTKMLRPEYSNMLLLVKMKDALEELMYQRKQKVITMSTYEKMVNKLHLNTEGKVVEPFCALAERHDREERQRIWYESLAVDLEEECLIR